MTMVRYLHNTLRAVSFMLLFKGIVGGALATLALFGYVVPAFLGWNPTPYQEGAAAGIGALIGAVLAIRG